MSHPGKELYQPVVFRGASVDTLFTVPPVLTLSALGVMVEVLCGFSETVVRE